MQNGVMDVHDDFQIVDFAQQSIFSLTITSTEFMLYSLKRQRNQSNFVWIFFLQRGKKCSPTGGYNHKGRLTLFKANFVSDRKRKDCIQAESKDLKTVPVMFMLLFHGGTNTFLFYGAWEKHQFEFNSN